MIDWKALAVVIAINLLFALYILIKKKCNDN